MVKTTKEQRAALFRVYNRLEPNESGSISRKPSYREFRKTVQPTFFCDDAVIVQFAGMWLCIETDGYTHS